MFLVVTREISVGRAQILPIHKILKMAAHKRLGFFRGHIDQAYLGLNKPSNTAGASTDNFSARSFFGLRSHSSSPHVQKTFGRPGPASSPPEKTAGDCCEPPF